MKLKKIFSFLVAAVMLAGTVNVSAITNEDMVIENSEAYTERLEMFENLGLLSSQVSYEDEKASVKREDFVIALLRLANSDNVSAVTAAPFTDVDVDYPTAAYIKRGADLGFLSGYADGSFGPKNDIMLEQAIKVMVKFLGYSDRAEMLGGYPNGYLNVATDIGLLDGVKEVTNSAITYGTLLKMFENAFDVNVPKLKYEDSTLKIDTESEISLLEVYHDIYEEDGIVNANDITALVGYKKQIGGSVKVGEYTYFAGDTTISTMLGYDLDFYYKKTEDEDIGTVLYYKLSKDNETYTILDEDLFKNNTTTSSYTYYDARDREKTIALTSKKNIIINGVQKSNYSVADLNPDYGQVTLIDNNGDSEYDIIDILSVTDTIVVNTVSATNDGYTVVDKLDASKTLKLKDETPAVYVILHDDEEITPVDLTENMVLSVCAADGYTKVLVSTDTIEGKVDSKISDDEFIIDGVNYYLTKNYKTISATSTTYRPIKIGNSGKFLLDVFGAIASSEAKTTDTMAYAVALQSFESKVEDDTVVLKVFDETGDIVRYTLEKELRFNGKKMTASEALTELKKVNNSDGARVATENTSTPFRQIIRYSLNEAGNIAKLYNTLSEELTYDGSFTQTSDYSYYLDTWGREYWENNTKIFILYDDEKDCEVISDYEIINSGDNKLGTTYFYNKDELLQVEAAIRYMSGTTSDTGSGSTSAEADMYIVKRSYEGLNADDEPTKIIEAVSLSGGEVKLYKDDELSTSLKTIFDSIVAGDVIRFTTSNSGLILGLRKVFDVTQPNQYGAVAVAQGNTSETTAANNGGTLSYTMAGLRSVYYVRAKMVSGTSLVADMPNGTTDQQALRMYKLGSTKVVRLDITNPKNIKIDYELSASDITPGDSVLLDLKQNTMRGIIIVKH